MSFTPNPNLMVGSPNLQEYFVDKDTGLPLSGGFVYYYEDAARETLKTVYELSGTAGSYMYTALPNPVPLSAVGTPQNGAGQDIRVYYYPYDENGDLQLYYIVVKSATAVTQLTRQAWPPYEFISPTPPGATNFIYNFVRNNTFYSWSNGTPFAGVGAGSVDNLDFFADDWTYQQNDAGQTISLSRGVFGLGVSPIPYDNPPYYFIYACSATGSTPVMTYNMLSQSYKSVQTLSGQTVTVSLWLQKLVASTNNNMSISMTQFFGTGGSPSSSIQIPGFTIDDSKITSTWTQFTGTFTIPTVSGTIGSNGDDALILNINLPLNIVQTINIAGVIMQQGASTATSGQEISNDNIRQNTDVIGLYPAFTTGDIKPTLKTISDPGWLLMDDTTIGSPLSGATHTGFKYYNLFKTIWTNVASTIWAPIFTSAGVLTTYGGAFDSDWGGNKRLSLTKVLGRALSGAGQSIIQLLTTLTPSTSTFAVNTTASLYVGTPVTFVITGSGVLPSGITALTTYWITNITSTTFQVTNVSLAAAVAGTAISLTGSDAGTAPYYVMATLTSQILGSYLGEYTEALTIAEMPSHNHPGSTVSIGTTTFGSSGSPAYTSDTPTAHSIVTVAAQGGSGAHNIIQPTAFMNVMIKL